MRTRIITELIEIISALNINTNTNTKSKNLSLKYYNRLLYNIKLNILSTFIVFSVKFFNVTQKDYEKEEVLRSQQNEAPIAD
jgi:hypothetical protein